MKNGIKENQIMVVIKEPGNAPRVEPLFDNSLKAFPDAVENSDTGDVVPKKLLEDQHADIQEG